MKKVVALMLMVMLPIAMLLAGCESQDYTGNTSDDSGTGDISEMKMIVNVNGTEFKATLENNSAAETLVSMIESNPLELDLRDYGGFEKVGSLGFSLPSSNTQITTHSGDIVLYQSMFTSISAYVSGLISIVPQLGTGFEALNSTSESATMSSLPRFPERASQLTSVRWLFSCGRT